MKKNPYPVFLFLLTMVPVISTTLTSCRNNNAGSSEAFNDAVIVPVLDTVAWNKRDTVYWAGNDPGKWPSTFAIGKVASQDDIDKIDIDVMPDGRGLPAGSGNATAGRQIYLVKCAACHGQTGREGPNNKLVALMNDTAAEKAIGNYWPYATTIFDYVRRAMPYNAPGSLTNREVYHLTAYLLAANQIIDSAETLTPEKLAKIKMPAHSLFIADDRTGGAEVR